MYVHLFAFVKGWGSSHSPWTACQGSTTRERKRVPTPKRRRAFGELRPLDGIHLYFSDATLFGTDALHAVELIQPRKSIQVVHEDQTLLAGFAQGCWLVAVSVGGPTVHTAYCLRVPGFDAVSGTDPRLLD